MRIIYLKKDEVKTKINKLILIIIMILLVPTLCSAKTKEKVLFSNCVDGDTAKFIYKKEETTFRFLAIDTPESTNKIEPYGKQASQYTCNELKNADLIEIEFDEDSDLKDKYGRYLAWIFVDNTLLQKKIIQKGYAKVAYLYGDYKYTKELQELEKTAKINKLNIWSDYNEEKESNIIYYLLLLFIIILAIFNKKFRKKIINKSKKKIDKKINKMLE